MKGPRSALSLISMFRRPRHYEMTEKQLKYTFNNMSQLTLNNHMMDKYPGERAGSGEAWCKTQTNTHL